MTMTREFTQRAVEAVQALLDANRLAVIHEEGGTETVLKVEVQPNGDVVIWVE
jgi:Fe-S cluster biogenesis protein NfuA